VGCTPGAKSAIYDYLVTIAPLCPALCLPAAPLTSESWRRPWRHWFRNLKYARSARLLL